MSDENLYRQCVLRRENVTTTTYIPTALAIVGNVVMLRQDDGSWTRGWVVMSAGPETKGMYAEFESYHGSWTYHQLGYM